MENKKQISFLLVVLTLTILSIAALGNKNSKSNDKQSRETSELVESSKESKVWIISDSHFISKELFDDGKQFHFIKKSAAGKDLDYQQERLDALTWQIEKERPKVLIVSGDLTLNGEKKSVEELASVFKKINDLGTKVYVIPGNHDISDGWARRYEGEKTEKARQILPGEFKDIFSEMGYGTALSQDPDSLSYVVQPFKNVQFLMIDTNKYINDVSDSPPQISGRIKESTYTWLKKVIANAKKDNVRIIPVMHHNVMDHNDIVNKGFTIDEAKKLQTFFSDNSIQVVLSGHIHSQDIASIEENGKKIYDIATGSFATLSNSIGEIWIDNLEFNYQQRNLDLSGWAKATGNKDKNLLDYQRYSTQLFMGDGIGMAYRQMFEENWFDEEESKIVGDFVGRMNVRFFDGKDYWQDEKNIKAIKEEAGYQILSQHPDSFLLKYVETIIADFDTDDTKVQITFEKFI